MKKVFLSFLTIAMFSTASFAQVTEDQILEQEDGAIATADMQPLTSEVGTYSKAGDAIVGGIIGAIGADRWDRDHHHPDRNVTCFARNGRGETFRATARRARAAQDLALRKCYRFSKHCRPVGCR